MEAACHLRQRDEQLGIYHAVPYYHRIEGHFVGDPEMYRKKEETKKILEENDPIIRFEERVVKAKLMTKKECEKLRAECIEKVAKAKEYAMSCEYPDPSEFYKDVYVD